MRYYVYTDNGGKINILDRYSTEEEAIKRLKYHMKKEKNNLKVMPIPQLKVGCSVYKRDGSYYGTIVNETNTLWEIANENNKDKIPDPYGKQRMEQWILVKGFIIVDYEDISNIEDMKDMMIELGEKVEKRLESLGYLNCEQVKLVV